LYTLSFYKKVIVITTDNNKDSVNSLLSDVQGIRPCGRSGKNAAAGGYG